MLVGLRERLVRNRTQLANAIRGYAAEFGLVPPRAGQVEPLLCGMRADESLPTWRANCSPCRPRNTPSSRPRSRASTPS